MAFAHINIENIVVFGGISLSIYILYTVLNIIEFKYYDKVSFDEEELDRIDTQEYARYFSELLTENLTFFLNGEWGIGKTEYLKVVKNYSGKKFVELNLWAIKDERTVINISFSKLHPIIYFFSKTLFIGCVVISILVTSAINLGLEKFIYNFTDSEIFVKIGVLIALFVAVWQFFKYESDDLYYRFFQCNISTYFLRNKVLVIDDFDRISKKNQEEAYKLFNCLNGKLPIIFVGDFCQIEKMQDKYLQKIIDRKIELPSILYSENIWNSYFSMLNKKLSVEISQSLIDLFVEEKRNLRERKMFHYYTTQELINRNKKEYVQINQQLALIYLYAFYPLKYNKLLQGEVLVTVLSEDKFKTLYEILENLENYPKPFERNKKGYYLYESVKILTESEAVSIMRGPNLKKELIEKGESSDGFYEYLSIKYEQLDSTLKDKLLDEALCNVFEGKSSSLIYFIIITTTNNFKSYGMDKIEIHEQWLAILENYTIDFSQKLYFLEEFASISYLELGKMYNKLDLYSKDFSQGKAKKSYFLTYLSSKGKWREYSWSKEYWDALDVIFEESYEEYLSILQLINIIDMDLSSRKIIVFNKIDNHVLHVSAEHIERFLSRVKPRLEQLQDKGFDVSYRDKK
ncbi:TPA: P-loop NTPase fold protein [Enterococcus faecalis]